MNLESNLQRQLHWIAAADSKTPGVFAIDAAMLGVLAASAPNQTPWDVAPSIAVSIAAVLLLASIGSVVAATFPRTAGPKGSMIFFAGVCEHDEDDYISKAQSVTQEDFDRDCSRQIYRNAEIASSKFKWVKRSMISMFLAVIPWICAVYLLN